MRSLSSEELLEIWESGLSVESERRILSLLGAALPDLSREVIADEPIGRRDMQLLTLRESLFGSEFAGVAGCPSCGERLQLSFRADDVRARPAETSTGPLKVKVDGHETVFRVPNTDDYAAIDKAGSVEAGRELLLRRCVLESRHEGKMEKYEEIPGSVIEAVAERISDADPQGNVELNLDCPECRHSWQIVFDIASFIWSEIDDWARRTLHDIHTIASAYGWSESEILRMNYLRRQAYLQFINGM